MTKRKKFLPEKTVCENIPAEMEARVNALMQKLIRANRMEDLTRSTQDAEFQRKLFEEFDL